MTATQDPDAPVFRLKLKKSEHQPQLDAFMEDLRNSALKTHGEQLIFLGPVVLEASDFAGKIHISSITSHAREQGYASKTLDWLIELADKHGVQLDGTIQRIGGSGLSHKELRSWYKRHGFTITETNKISYEPKPKPPTPARGDLGI